MLFKISVTTLALTLGIVGFATADTPSTPDPIGQALIRPDIVMAHQQELDLSDAQRNAIQSDVQQAQMQFTQLQWRLSAAVERLADILKQSRVDEGAALAQLDREQVFEREIKRAQLQLMIRVKNELTPEQQAKAFALERSGG